MNFALKHMESLTVYLATFTFTLTVACGIALFVRNVICGIRDEFRVRVIQGPPIIQGSIVGASAQARAPNQEVQCV